MDDSAKRLPMVSWKDVARVLSKKGFVKTRQTGSHLRFKKKINNETRYVTLPIHQEIKRGTLNGILTQAGFTKNELISFI